MCKARFDALGGIGITKSSRVILPYTGHFDDDVAAAIESLSNFKLRTSVDTLIKSYRRQTDELAHLLKQMSYLEEAIGKPNEKTSETTATTSADIKETSKDEPAPVKANGKPYKPPQKVGGGVHKKSKAELEKEKLDGMLRKTIKIMLVGPECSSDVAEIPVPPDGKDGQNPGDKPSKDAGKKDEPAPKDDTGAVKKDGAPPASDSKEPPKQEEPKSEPPKDPKNNPATDSKDSEPKDNGDKKDDAPDVNPVNQNPAELMMLYEKKGGARRGALGSDTQNTKTTDIARVRDA